MTSPVPDGTKPGLLVLASTYPRWPDDPEPGFVHELAKQLTGEFSVTVVGPHAPGAMTDEVMDGVRVRRYRYAPEALETLVNDGGIVTNLKRHPWKWLLVPGFVIAMGWASWRSIRSVGPNVIHAHWLLPQGLVVACLGLLARALPPFVVTSHGADLYTLRNPAFVWMKRFAARRATAITVVSHGMLAELARIGVDASRATVQPMGVDFSRRFTLDGSQRSRHEILFVGRLVEKKGLKYLLEAMPAILSVHPRAFLTVAGFGPGEAACREQVERLGIGEHIQFLGAVPQSALPALYRRAAVFVAPFVEADSGDQEGLGLVMVEAVACGCPVVASDLPAVGEVFDKDDRTLLVQPRNASSVARAVSRVLSEPYDELAATRRRAKLEQAFAWPQVARVYATLLESCLRVVP